MPDIPAGHIGIQQSPFSIRHSAFQVLLSIRVIPRSPRTAFAGRRGDALLVRLPAPPVDDAANEALVDFLARAFNVARRDVQIVSGRRSRDKRVRIEGLPEAEISARLSAMLEHGPPDDSR